MIVNCPLLPTEMSGEDERVQLVKEESEILKEMKRSDVSISGVAVEVSEVIEMLKRDAELLESERSGVRIDVEGDCGAKVHDLSVEELEESMRMKEL